MRKLKIGYVPFSKDFSSPGDRRRVVFWANARGHSLTRNLDDNLDLIFLSEKSDFVYERKNKRKVPVIFDLIDGYLSPNSFAEDFMRGFAKSLDGSMSGKIKPFSRHVRDMCLDASAVICSSVEQAELIKRYNRNVHIILDSHDEIPFVDYRDKRKPLDQDLRLLWEGQPATISGLNQILPFLSANLAFRLELVTDPDYFRFMNKYLKGQTTSLIECQKLDKLSEMNLRSWSIQNLTQASGASTVGILPLNLSKPMMRMKPENRLLIMWRMGLPCLVSPLDSFKRVAQNAQVDAVCVSNQDWLDQLLKLSTEVSYVNDQMERAQSYVQEFHSKEVILKKWDQLAGFVLDEK